MRSEKIKRKRPPLSPDGYMQSAEIENLIPSRIARAHTLLLSVIIFYTLLYVILFLSPVWQYPTTNRQISKERLLRNNTFVTLSTVEYQGSVSQLVFRETQRFRCAIAKGSVRNLGNGL